MDPRQHEAQAEPKKPKPLATPVQAAEGNELVFTDDNGVEHRIPLRPLQTAEPNAMTYTDDKGVEHSIYLPQGTMHTACEHLQNERWDELAKFEPYTNQGYTEDDFKKYEETHKQGQEK